MRKVHFIVIAFFTTIFSSFSQSLGYQDLALLFSKNPQNGTARFTSMGGAFGALGGDVSAINVNPAGLAVFTNSMFTGSLNSLNSRITSTYYGNSLTTENEFLNLTQLGAVLVFDSGYTSDWNKFAMGFNYRITKNFDSNFIAEGNSGVSTFTTFPYDTTNPQTLYDLADGQFFNNSYSGEISELNVAFSAVHKDQLYVGLGLNFYDLNFAQQATLEEYNSSAGGETLDATFYQENFTTGTGFSANLGVIYKANQNFRFGFAYQTPTWYADLFEESNIISNDGYDGDTRIVVSNDNRIYRNTDIGGFPVLNFAYRLRTPSHITLSAAMIVGKAGLISVDYTNRFYNGMRLSNADFRNENQFFANDLRNTDNLNIGTEWRFDRLSIRGGYVFEQSPDKFAIDSDNLRGYTLGAGYNFGNFKIDVGYANNNQTSIYNFYQGFGVNAAELYRDNRSFTASLTINL